jgi:3-phenylpropionate/trans-cinnamate dioxygenase ferredoxin subunit
LPIEDGSLKEVVIDGHEIVLARISGQLFAAENRCPHRGVNLYLGTLQGSVVTCPRHGSQFDLKDGSVIRWLKGSGVISALGKAIKSPRSIKTYPIKIEDNQITIDI